MAEHVELCQFEGGNRRVGRQAVRDWMEWRFTQWGLSRHYPLNHRITALNRNDGKGIVNGWAEMAMDNKIYVTAIRYYDDYVREDGAWRFARRETAMYYYAPATDLPAIYATPYRKALSRRQRRGSRASRRSPRIPARVTRPGLGSRSLRRTPYSANRSLRRETLSIGL
jgi:hypothetical protein